MKPKISMNRRAFFCVCLLSAFGLSNGAKLKQYKFRIKTKTKTIIGLVVQGFDLDNAKYRLNKKYPGCEIISVKEVK